ncbi:hypothetical protein ABPG73_018753, partial [Tetrahymena malaccensis]
MSKRPSKKSLGPLYKINFPRFQFEEADQEEKFVDQAIIAYQQGKPVQRQTPNRAQKNQKLPPLEQNDIFSPKYSVEQSNSIMSNSNKGQLRYNQSEHNLYQSLQIPLQQQQLQSQQDPFPIVRTSGQGGSLSMTIDQTQMQKSLLNKPGRNLKVNQSQKISTPTHQVQSQQASTKLLGQQQSQATPLRGVDGYKQTENSFSHNYSSLAVGNQPYSPQVSKKVIHTHGEEQNLEDTGKDFADKGLNTNKNLRNYDCWDEETTPQQWLEKFKKNPQGPHGKCPIYLNKQYEWTDVQVLDYDENTDKYLVRIIATDQLKHVVRLSLMFNEEDQTKFKERVDLSKSRQVNAEDAIRFDKYVNKVADDLIQPLSAEWRKQIFNFVTKRPKHSQDEKVDEIYRSKYVQELFEDAERQYIFFIKKCYVLKEMADPKNEQKWQKYRIRNRYEEKILPFYGTYVQLQYNFNENQDSLSKLHVSNKQLVVKTLNMVTQRTFLYENHKLINTTWNEQQLPILLSNFDQQQRAYHISSRSTLQMQWREYIISEIQDTLRDIYRFYQTESKLYFGSDLQRLLKRIDLMFNTFMRENVVKGNINDYCKFIQKFTIPEQNDESIWHINNFPLLILNLQLNQKPKKKGKKPNKDRKEETPASQQKEEYEEEDIIYYEPTYQQICQTLMKPFDWIVESVNMFFMLEKDLVPLIDLPKLPSFQIDNQLQWIKEGQEKVLEYIKVGYEEPNEILERFKKYQFLMEKSISSVTKLLFGEAKEKPLIQDINPQDVDLKIQEYFIAKKEIEKQCIDQKNCHFFQVRTKQAKNDLVHKADEFVQSILQKVDLLCFDNIERIQKTYEDICDKLKKIPQNEEELVALKAQIKENEVNLAKIANEVNCVGEFLKILEKYCFSQKEVSTEQFFLLKVQPATVLEAAMEGNRTYEIYESKFRNNLEIEKDGFQNTIVDIQKRFQHIKQYKSYNASLDVKENYTEVANFGELIQQASEKVKSFNSREALFGDEISIWDELDNVAKEFDPYHRLWDILFNFTNNYEEWTNGSFLSQIYHEIEKTVNSKYYLEAKALLKKFSDENDPSSDERAAQLSEQLLKDIQDFRQKLWIFELLTTEAMRNLKKPMVQQHWAEIFERCNVQGKQMTEDMTFIQLLAVLNPIKDVIEEVSRKAEKQYQIEKKLKEMEETVKVIKLDIMEYTKSKRHTFVLKGVDEIQQILDDQLNILTMMKASPYIKNLKRIAEPLEQRLVFVQDTLEGWIKCQRSWMYLEPIFASEDIKKKMELQKQKFDTVDDFWRTTMESFAKEPGLWEGIENDRLKNEFNQHNKTLDEIQKKLSDYLESKRRDFPRFFFLSDEELLEILADTKDPQKVQKHINKCFEAINKLDFSSKEDVSGMISAESENVKFNSKINVNEGDKKGNVEKWLGEIEHMMRSTLKNITKSAMIDESTARNDWVQKWAGQVVLAVNMVRWTRGAENAILNSRGDEVDDGIYTYSNLADYVDFLENQLKDTVQLVRKDLTPLARLTLGALVVLDVHAKDVIVELKKSGCTSSQDFNWISQLRYYWEEKHNKPDLKVQMISANLSYDFEYLGNSTRLVITPLTDRCYRTLMGAFQLQYGGAPEGPAGTGKTETVKDLAKALAVQCVVFNCSDGLNYVAMRKFFKGLASSGAWCCFDEFNRIDLEVLSVIASQVLTIQMAIRSNKTRPKETFEFDGEEIKLVDTCAINITMNPGYAGRSELPDNLKSLFRPCAMMVPDYAMISEIYLYSVGFEEARNLARKIVASLRLSSEQLSSQDHYDFGMRALKAILTAAGNLKRVMTDSEDIICLRALMDVNLPKFTINDIPLFKSITSDLFPGVELPFIDYGDLLESLKNACKESQLQPKQNFLNKCIQLYDTINVRHGLMVVGQAFSGKSSITQTLQNALSALKGKGDFQTVHTHKLNPKSITSDQLYGKLDPDTKTWADGVIAIIMRVCSQDTTMDKQWVVFDGPVDAVWIENMNTVLDDNKKLCLTSGEIIKLTNQMTMMFEVEDLAQASPATVSRCGMVFLETKQLGWDPLVKSFIQQLPSSLDKVADQFEKILTWLIDCSLCWAMRHGKFLVHKSEMTLVGSCLKYLKTYIKEYGEENVKVQKDIEDILANVSLFCVIWSIGACLEETTRKPFHQFITELVHASSEIPDKYQIKYDLMFPFEPHSIRANIPDKCSIFDLCYDKTKGIWVNWTQTEKKFEIPKGGEYHNIFVPTIDSIRNNFFLHRCVQNQIHLLVCGPTGTGKTVNVINELNKHYLNPEYSNLQTAFSGQTNVNQVQRLIESKVCTRRRKGHFGPEEGKKFIVIFIDDLNMPAKEKYGAQPPIELLRQWMDNGGWYDLADKTWKYLCDIIFITAMLPPTGGRNTVTLRYMRHFNLLYVESFEAESLHRIFSNLLDWYFLNQKQGVGKAIENLRDSIVNSTIELYQGIQNSKQLLPTPAKSHYIYNLRDISKVFQGISKATSRSYKDENDFLKLWAHECMRVFQDRMINSSDQQVFEEILKEIMRKNFRRDWKDLVTVEPLLWASFVPTLYPDGDTSKRRLSDIYCELSDREELKRVCYDQLAQFNDSYPQNKMNLVLFMTAIQHIIKIVRVITTPFGHCLLVGVGGSGRKSLATLSAFIAFTNEIQTIDHKSDMKIWIEELQKVMKVAGVDNKPTTLLFSDTQIFSESLLEDICNILNNGEVPNLFPPEEKAKIMDEINDPSAQTNNQKYQVFLDACKRNLHLVLAFSPVGEAFRRRLRTFPTLVNCTTIDWFLPWPEEALRNTASSHFINVMKIESESTRDGLIEIVVDMQTRISNMSIRYREELRKYYYVTPTSYLELLGTFERMLKERQTSIQNTISRYETGVLKIDTTEKDVNIMKKRLEELKPQLEIKTEENQKMLINLQKKQKEADAKREVCESEERDCKIQKDNANALKEDCQRELDKVLPILAEAVKILSKISKDDINILKSFQNPSPSVVLVFEGLCYAFDEDQFVKSVPIAPGAIEKKKDFWDYSKKKLLNDKLLSRVRDFDDSKIRAINPVKIDQLKQFISNPLFDEDKIQNASSAAANLSKWIRAVVQTYDALLIVEPKKKQLEKAESDLRQAEEILNIKKAALQEVLDLLAKLQSEYDVAKREKEELQAEVTKCEIQLDRAEKLINGLGGEKNSWKQKAISNREESTSVIGDCVLSSGIIAYLGAFPIAYREEAIHNWKELLLKYKIKFSNDYSLQKILCDPITIGQWTDKYQLPNDSFSIDNAIILNNSQRWPLMIDPQIQANNWIKKLEGDKLLIFNPNSDPKNVLLKLENCIPLGTPVLLENVSENIDSLYESVLLKKLTKKGSSYTMKFMEKQIEYHEGFRFYVTTKYPRPHYPPEICVKVTLLNFQVTPEGLEDQMLNITVKQEDPHRDQIREKNIVEFFQNKERQKHTEDMILQMLFESTGNLLDDEKLIEQLQQSKKDNIEIQDKLKRQENDRELYNQTRNSFKELGKRVANLYFVVLDLALIEPTYQWSLEFYIELFLKGIKTAAPAKDNKENRSKNIINQFQILLYESICRSLLEKDKLIFSFLMCMKILEIEKKINSQTIRFLMVGGTWTSCDHQMPEKAQSWLSNKAWCILNEADSVLPQFKGFVKEFEHYIEHYKKLNEHETPYEEEFPGAIAQNLHYFSKLILIRALFPDKFSKAVQKLIISEMSEQYIQPPPFNLDQTYLDSRFDKPLIFILSPGADPRIEINTLATKLGIQTDRFKQISLGQGQGELAEKSIRAAYQDGSWVLLQNCHLAPSFMPRLEKILETYPEDVDREFRIWLTSMPSDVFPPSILMKGIKMTYEPPRGLKNNLQRTYGSFKNQDFDTNSKPAELKKLCFGLAFFHALILERRKYGPLGWNIPYEFTVADFQISLQQLKEFLNKYDEIPYEALNYMVAEANYGGRVTDPKDRRLIKIILRDFYTPEILDEEYKFSESGKYFVPPVTDVPSFQEYIQSMDRNDPTEIFGMHPNAAITSAIIETNFICNTVLSLLPRSTGGSGKSAEEIIKDKIKELQQKLPPLFDVEQASLKHPVSYEESMNTVLQQELIRFNKLLNTVKVSLVNVGKAIDGLLVMSSDLEEVFNSVFDNKVPDIWHK